MAIYILLIEDNPGDAVIFREKLNASDLDYKLATAKRMSEGLERIEGTDFDIVLVDLSLPDTSGLETVSKVREAAPDLPLIVLTGLDDATTAAEAKKLGAVDYLVKWYVDSVSLARYIRYAIAQYQMFGEGEGSSGNGNGAAPPKRPKRPSVSAEQVVEGELLGASGNGGEATSNRSVASKPAEPDKPATPPRANEPAEDVCEAIAAAEAALLIVDGDGTVAFASDAARAWVPNDRYPWPVEAGVRRITREDGNVLEQHASPTEWGGEDAYLVNLRVPPEIPAVAPSDTPSDGRMLRQASEAALSYVESAAQKSLWMAGVLRSTLDLHRVMAGDVERQMEDVDVLEIAQQVVREERSLAMSYGLPLRTVSDRKKAISYADRNLVHTLVHRLVVDAVHAAGADGVEVTVEVEKRYSAIEVAWTESDRAVDPTVAACVGLGQQIVQHIARLVEGESHHERKPSGHHTFTVHLPCRTADCET